MIEFHLTYDYGLFYDYDIPVFINGNKVHITGLMRKGLNCFFVQ